MAPPKKTIITTIPTKTARKQLTPESLLRQAPDILETVDQAPIFKEEREREFPTFTASEITFGKILGAGAFGVVREVTNILSSDAINPSAGISSSEGGREDNHHYNDATDAREIMAKRVMRNGDARYAVKYLIKGDDELTDMERARGRIDLAIEVKYLRALNHPNIVRMRGMLNTKDLLDSDNFFVMDRLYGTLEGKFAEWKTEKKAAAKGVGNYLFKNKQARDQDKHHMQEMLIERLTVAFDLSNAFRYMHSHKIVYRDIKPENIGFDVRGDVKVFDFGLARSLMDEDHACGGLYHLTARTGSFPYMAPEVAKCEPYNAKADVFSFGMLLWQIMALSDEPYPLLKTRRQYYDKVSVAGVRPAVGRKWPAMIQQAIQKAWSPSAKVRPNMSDLGRMLMAQLTQMTHDKRKLLDRSKHLADRSMNSLHMSLMKRNTSKLDMSRHESFDS